MIQTANAGAPKRHTGQESFVQLAGSLFSAGSDQALVAYSKLRSFMSEDAEIGRLLQSAQQAKLNLGYDGVVERVRGRLDRMNVSAIVRSVLAPLAGGYLGYALAGAVGIAGGTAVLVGFLVGAVIWLAMYPGTLAIIQEKIESSLNDIFSPF